MAHPTTLRRYQHDAYQKQLDTTVIASDGNAVQLAETVFFPSGGGVLGDTGMLQGSNGESWQVLETLEQDLGEGVDVWHILERAAPSPSTSLHGELDWARRYRLMRYHTAAHVLCGVMFQQHGVRVTGNQLTPEKGRIDFSFKQFDRSIIEQGFAEANTVITKNLPVEVRFISADEARQRPDLFKLEVAFKHSEMDEIRLVDIVGFDVQADGGCHVARLEEIGPLTLRKTENKGKGNRRIYFTLD